jgi:lysine biosynthesis protein LysW
MSTDLPITAYCPECGAYLLVLADENPVVCDQCGCEFEIVSPK